MFVKLWMSRDLVTVKTDQTIAEVRQGLEENKIRRIPVVGESGELVGIISREDVLKAMPSEVDGSSAGSQSLFSESTRVAEIMTPDPMFVAPMTSLETVAKKMRKHKVGGIPVVEEGRLVGIITESDIFLAFMEILGINEEGTRLEVIISDNMDEFYTVMEIFRRYRVLIRAVAIHNNFGRNQRLLTVRMVARELDTALDALRKANVRINSIEREDDIL
jgi:acetoin utilization protein AcuB